ncbi:MAG: AraC family transcriptional regulator [Pseudomonadota bacterium]
MDLLDTIFETLALKGVVYFRTDFSGPWAVRVPELAPAARFHLVLQGQCSVAIDAGPVITLLPGDLIMVPKGRSHVVADREGRLAAPLETVLSDAGFTGEGTLTLGEGDPRAAVRTFCGHFAFRPHAAHPLIDAMPDHIHVTAADRLAHPWLDSVLQLIGQRVRAEEGGRNSAGAATLIRLSEVVFIEVLRAGISADPTLSALIAGLQDAQIGRAVAAIHRAPDRAWSVAELAAEAGMSRSVFAERFLATIGQPPIGYLAEWRLQRALALLDEGRLGVQQIAAATGYRSAASLSRAFAKRFGCSPTAHRRAGQPGNGVS